MSREVFHAEPGYSLVQTNGFAWNGFPAPVYHCRAHTAQLDFELMVPKGIKGTLRLFMTDPDQFGGGRVQTLQVDDLSLGTFDSFVEGKWCEVTLDSKQTGDGLLRVEIKNMNPKSNAVLSKIEFIEEK